jgi:ABC-type polysaccharide/polyol phosphate export permease
MFIMSFVFSKILRFGNFGVPYPLFIYAGLLPWTFMVASLQSSMGVFVSDASLIKKIYFPREVLVIATLLAKTFDFFLASIIFLLLMIFYQVPFTGFMIIFFLIFLIQFIFTYGLSLLLSALNLFYRDIQYLVNLIITLWFYLTPVVYAVEFFPARYRIIFQLNPMSVLINAYRQVLLGGNWPNWQSLAIAALVSILIFIFCHRIFKKLERLFADIV